MKNWSKKFTQGFCLAIAEMYRNNSDSRSAKAALDAAGYSLEEIEKAEVAEFDLEAIREIYKIEN